MPARQVVLKTLARIFGNRNFVIAATLLIGAALFQRFAESGDRLVHDWGSATPVVYALAADGTLAGLWDGGDGEKVLTPAR